MYIFEPNIEQITISEQVAVIPDERWSLVSQMKTFLLRNLCILNHQHCIKASGKRTSLEPLQVKHAVTQISLIRHFSLRQIKLTAKILKQSLRLSSFCQPRYVSNIIQPNVCMLRMFSANIPNLNITISDHANFDLRAILWVQREFVKASCNYSAQVAKV